MKKLFFLAFVFLLSTASFSQSFILKGTVVSKDGPLAQCSIVNRTLSKEGKIVGTTTNSKGEFSIQANKGDILVFTYVGYDEQQLKVMDDKEIKVTLSDMGFTSETVSLAVGGGSVSLKNPWVGAKVGYNFIGNTDDNFFVGSATIALNLLDNNDDHHTFGIIGNIGNFKFNKDSTDSKNIQKMAQSINGLSVGLGYTHQTSIKGTNKYKSNQYPTSYFREFFQTGVRLTSFTKVGPDSSTQNLAQSVSTGGFEFEQTGFKNGGSITASLGLSLYLFDKSIYKKVFNESKSSLIALDFTTILPISKNMGFFINGTFAPRTSAAYILGVIFKADDK